MMILLDRLSSINLAPLESNLIEKSIPRHRLTLAAIERGLSILPF